MITSFNVFIVDLGATGCVIGKTIRMIMIELRMFCYNFAYSSFIKLWQSCSDPHPKISPIAIFAFYSLNYSLVARLQDNSRPKSPTKIKTKTKLQQFTVSGWLIINGGESGSEQLKMFSMKYQSN